MKKRCVTATLLGLLLPACLVLLAGCRTTAPAPLPDDGDPEVSLTFASKTAVAGRDVRLNLALHSKQGRNISPAMLDMSCFRIRLAGGEVIVPPPEGLDTSAQAFGSDLTVSRTVNLGSLLAGACRQTVDAWWEYGEMKSDEVSIDLFEWPLDSVEAVMETQFGTMVFHFAPDKAPRTVENFVKLSLDGFYDGRTFHRVIEGFMIQGGCPRGDGTGDPGYTIPAEFNDLSHRRGVISMARSHDPDSAGCQFFVMDADTPGLDWNYTAFGWLVDGLETLDAIAAVETTYNAMGTAEDRPVEPPLIKKVTIRPVRSEEEQSD